METMTFIKGIAVGAVAGAITALLLAPKSGRGTRDGISEKLVEVKDAIVDRLQTVEDFSQATYHGTLDAVIAEYSAARKITLDQARQIESILADSYEAVRQMVHEHTALEETAPA